VPGQPRVERIDPSAAAAGSGEIITISGLNFGATQGSSTLTINGVAASIVSWSNNAIRFRVAAATPPEPGRAANSPASAAVLRLTINGQAVPVTDGFFVLRSWSTPIPLRYLAINVGNLYPGCWTYKLCDPSVVRSINQYINIWEPDVIMFSEVYREAQLLGSNVPGTSYFEVGPFFFTNLDIGGPLLPVGYNGICGKSTLPDGSATYWDTPGSSGEHECIAWKTRRVQLVAGSEDSVYGYEADNAGYPLTCNPDFTAFSARLVVDQVVALRAVAVHPASNASHNGSECRSRQIYKIWEELAGPDRNVVIGGDWNTENPVLDEDDPPPASYAFQTNYGGVSLVGGPLILGFGNHWDTWFHATEWSAATFQLLDHAFSKFNDAWVQECTDCGVRYYTDPGNPFGLPYAGNLRFGSALGSSMLLSSLDDHPKADYASGGSLSFMDHSQILVDMMLNPIQYQGPYQAGDLLGRQERSLGGQRRGATQPQPIIHSHASPNSYAHYFEQQSLKPKELSRDEPGNTTIGQLTINPASK